MLIWKAISAIGCMVWLVILLAIAFKANGKETKAFKVFEVLLLINCVILVLIELFL